MALQQGCEINQLNDSRGLMKNLRLYHNVYKQPTAAQTSGSLNVSECML